jgi:hypothetical protein
MQIKIYYTSTFQIIKISKIFELRPNASIKYGNRKYYALSNQNFRPLQSKIDHALKLIDR